MPVNTQAQPVLPRLASIEQGIKDAIKALSRDYIAEIKTYGGEFDVGERDFQQVVQRFPAIWTTFKQAAAPKKLGANRWKQELTFTVIVAARSIRTEETARHGAYDHGGKLLDVGSFQLIEDVEQALLNSKLGLCIDPLQPSDIRTLFNTKTEDETISVLTYDWKTELTKRTPDREEDVPYIEQINVNYFEKSTGLAADQFNLAETENQTTKSEDVT